MHTEFKPLDDSIVNQGNTKNVQKPTYQKPKTTLFLKDASLIKGGDGEVLESQSGDGYLSS
ncbi:MAG: hypothetical protein K0U37_00100 [Gammaproteobacteria bacterium]|nr:hypothetical protein [Gammaproteobacteria bacterium]